MGKTLKFLSEPKAYLLSGNWFSTEDAEEMVTELGHEYKYKVNSEAAMLIEFAARACHQLWENDETTIEYIERTIRQEHGFILAHSHATIGIICSRGTAREFMRHEDINFSEMSYRFKEAPAYAFIPYLVQGRNVEIGFASGDLWSSYRDYEITLEQLAREEITGKVARETAKEMLSEAMLTYLIATGSMVAWRRFVLQRTAPTLVPDVRIAAYKIYEQLIKTTPEFFPDYEVAVDDTYKLNYIKKV